MTAPLEGPADRPDAVVGTASVVPTPQPLDADLEVLRDVVGMLSDPTLVLDRTGRVILDNVAARDLLGVTPLEGCDLRDLATEPDTVDELLRRWRTTTAGRPGVITVVNGDRLRCDGARLRARPLLLVQLRPQRRALQAFTQMTAQIDAANLRQLNDRLQSTVAELSSANRRLAAANDELDQYASAVSHDLRTPLFTIKAYLDLLIADGSVSEDGMPMAEASMRGIRRLERTIAALLSVARLEPAERPSEPVEARRVLDQVLESMRTQLDGLDAEVVVGPLPPLLVAEAPLAQVLQNLIDNSLAHRSPDRRSRIEITARRVDGMAEITVRDNGTGIPQGEHERIFDLFHRGNADDTGTGIGLTTCRKLTSQWGGHIRSVPVDEGALFTFTAPTPPLRRTPTTRPRITSEREGQHHVRL